MSIADYFPLIRPTYSRYVTSEGQPIYAVLAEFDTPADVYHAAEMVRDAGYKKWDVHSPFPIHGMEEAMGVKRTLLPWLVGGAALSGFTAAVAMQYFMNAIDYQFVVQGKDDWAWEAYLPVTFELAVLFSAFAALLGMLSLNGLPRFHHPIFNSERFLSSTDDKYFIAIESKDPRFDPQATPAVLRDAGASHIELVEDD
ncbi:MAG: DUF3341 domain-containing protein [Planctomycetota bacterium]